MRRFIISLALTGVFAAATAAHAVPVSFKHAFLNTDWTSAAVGGVGGGSGTIALTGVSGTVTGAYLYWHGMNNSGAGSVYDNANINLNDNPVSGTSIGDATTNCWGSGSSRAFVADVKSLVTGNGAYVLTGLSAAPGNNANGASLIVLFDDGNPNNNRDLAVFDGNDSNTPDGFPGEDTGWHSVLGGINFQGGLVSAQTHSADGQRFDPNGLDDNSLVFSSASGSVTINDAGGLWDGESVPDAGTSRATNGSLWDVHTFDISAAFTTPGSYTLSLNGQDPYSDCLGLVVLLIDLNAGSVSCGNGTVDQGEQCDPEAQASGCTSPAICTGQCICGCELDSQCEDQNPCTKDTCIRATGECTHLDICPPPASGACCMYGECFVVPSGQCSFYGTYQGDDTNCQTPGICAGVCGNGVIESGEECDDANTTAGDGCDASCKVEACWTCIVGQPTAPAGPLFPGSGPSQCTPDSGTACDDGNACTVDDTCSQGVCIGGVDICATTTSTTTSTTSTTTSTTVPITGACCSRSVAGNCAVVTQIQCLDGGTYQGDGTNCETAGICSTCGNGLVEPGEQCDDANTTAGDGCNSSCAVEPCWACVADAIPTTTLGPPGAGLSGPSHCTPDDGASCDDGDLCTVGDSCSAGTCGGNAVVLPAACRWVMVGDTKVQSRTRGQSSVTGDICGGRVRIGEFTTNSGDAVATLDNGVGIQISSHAVVAGNIISGGSSVRGKPRLVRLPGLDTDVVAGGTTAARTDFPAKYYDTLGTNSRVDDCAEAQGDVSAGDSLLAGLPAGTNLGDTVIPAGGALTLTASNPGGLNVFDFRTLLSARDVTLTLDAAGNPGSVFVLRVQKKLDMRLRSKIVLAGGALPGKVILYSQAKCRFGLEVSGVGTVFCPKGKLILEPRTQWQGALVGGRGRVELRDSGVLVHMPLQIGS